VLIGRFSDPRRCLGEIPRNAISCEVPNTKRMLRCGVAACRCLFCLVFLGNVSAADGRRGARDYQKHKSPPTAWEPHGGSMPQAISRL
jgi:hypothetical protein